MRVLGIDGSPIGGGRTAKAISRVLAAASGDAGSVVSVAQDGVEAALAAAGEVDALVVGTPVYRATYAAPLKEWLDRLPRGMWGETSAPLRGRAVAIVATGASLHHFLALDSLRNVLAGFFAAHVVPPGLYVPRDGFEEDALADEYEERAAAQGRALVELAAALAASSTLRTLEPQA